MEICTIIAKNYLAYARVLGRSVAEHDPDARLWTLIIDDFSGYVDPSEEPFEVVTPQQIGCDPFVEMAMRYSVLELSTAVKPWLLRYLMRETGNPITYLDPDIKLYASLERLDELAARHGVVLIPHNTEPIPPDGRNPSQVDIMIAGVYNLGYVSLAPGAEVDRLLDWWADRLTRDCRVDPRWGYFVDQRWFDLAPGFLSDVAIVREPEYDVAYWNLHARRLTSDGGRYLVNGRPLAFFHFSGFDPEHPLVLSRHQDRIDVTTDPVLEQLLAGYAEDVLTENHRLTREWPYSYGALGDGTPIDPTLRALYDEFADEQNGSAVSPFTLEGARAFARWFSQDDPGVPAGVNRVLARVYQDRPDLRRAYPDLAADRDRLRTWAEQHGRREVPLLARLMTAAEPGSAPAAPMAAEAPPRTTADRAPGAPLSRERWGVNVVGYFRSELGTGEAARQVVRALDAKRIPTLPIHGQTIPLSRQGHAYETAAPEDAPYPVNLICMNADMLPEFARQAGDSFFAGRYSIGVWFWEVSRFPERWRSSFDLLEEVWAPTEHVAEALRGVATVPVSTVRIPVAPAEMPITGRPQLGLPEDEFLFLFSFDYLSVFERKNPLTVIEAFRRAFDPGEGAQLVLKCINHDRDPESHSKLKAAAAGHPDIELIDRYLSPADNNSLIAVCDSYVSLHRAEGFGLGMAEAMWNGKPVIATGYSGNLDFMTSSNSLLVPYKLIPIGEGAQPYPADGEWADPDVEQAAAFMRQLFEDRERASELGTVAAQDIRRTHSVGAAGEIMYRRLESIRGTGRVRRRAVIARPRSPALAALPLKVAQGPSGMSPRRRAVRALLRSALLRAMRPFTVYQQTVNAELVSALEELGVELTSEIAQARADAAEQAAQLLAELRAGREALPAQVAELARKVEELTQQHRPAG